MLIFSDVDGTLLGDGGRCDLPAATLRSAFEHHTVILASSRDTGELRDVQQLIGLRGALVAEDGAVVADDAGSPELLGASRKKLVAAMRGALSATQLDGLLEAEPLAARGRLGSILIPVELATPAFQDQLADASLSATPGGNWATITMGCSKGAAASVLAGRRGVSRWAAIGNAQNDVSLLSAAAQAFVIRNADGHDPLLENIPDAVLLTTPGPEGWLEMLDLLEQRSSELP